MRREPRWVPRVVVEAVHLDQLREHGGLAGLRDEAALEAALARPRHRWDYGEKPDIAAVAAAYAYGLVKAHAFVDGNKRIAFVTAVVFLGLNGLQLVATETDVVRRMVALAAGELDEAGSATWIREHAVRRDA